MSIKGCPCHSGCGDETEMDFPIFSVACRGSYRPLFTLIIVLFILANDIR